MQSFRAGFAITDEIHLNNAGVAPQSLHATNAMMKTMLEMQRGTFALSSILPKYQKTRTAFAKLLGVSSDYISYFQTCAAAISQAAHGIELRAGDEVLLLDQEYPSNAYPWHQAAQKSGASVVICPSVDAYRVDLQALLDRITPRTKVVAVSWVQYQTGTLVDLKLLADAAHQVGALLVVDAIQGLGVLPFDMLGWGVDVVCGGTHKWLCGPMGHGFIAVSPQLREHMPPLLHGAMTYGTSDDPVDPHKSPRRDPTRFEPGTPLLWGSIGAAAAVEHSLECGIEAIGAHACMLADRVAAELEAVGCTVLGIDLSQKPEYLAAWRSPITTCVPPPHVSIENLLETLRNRKIAVQKRAGGVRISPHGFNTNAEIDALLDVFSDFCKKSAS